MLDVHSHTWSAGQLIAYRAARTAQSQTPPAVDQLPALPLSPTRAQGTRSPTRPQGATSPKRAPPNSPYTSSPSSQQPSVPSSSVRIQSAMPILQVKSLRASLSFYATVLGFHIIAQHGNAHAVLTSFTSGRGSNAGICLRAEDQMPAGPSGSGAGGLSRSASLNRSGAAGGISRAGSLRRPAPATPARVQPAVSTSESSAAGAASEIPPSSGSGSGGLRRANSVATRSARAAPPPPPPPRISASSASTTGGGPALSGICVLLEISGSLESLRATFDNAMSTWVKEAREAAESGEGLPEARRWDGARVVGEIEEKVSASCLPALFLCVFVLCLSLGGLFCACSY